jgi:hypothetical protein
MCLDPAQLIREPGVELVGVIMFEDRVALKLIDRIMPRRLRA